MPYPFSHAFQAPLCGMKVFGRPVGHDGVSSQVELTITAVSGVKAWGGTRRGMSGTVLVSGGGAIIGVLEGGAVPAAQPFAAAAIPYWGGRYTQW